MVKARDVLNELDKLSQELEPVYGETAKEEATKRLRNKYGTHKNSP